MSSATGDATLGGAPESDTVGAATAATAVTAATAGNPPVEGAPAHQGHGEEEPTNDDGGLIEAEDDEGNDSGYDTTGSSFQTSVNSSVFLFNHEHGHRYHRKTDALLPNDDNEQERLDLQHEIFKLLLEGELAATPIEETGWHILDIGTGTGIWSIDVGDAHPSATIIGVDESPIQPSWIPANVQFEIDDVTKPWLQKSNSVDFVHVRTMAGCIADWPAMLREAFKVLKPGGHIEVADIVWNFECQDGTLLPDSKSKYWADTFHTLAQSQFHVDFAPSPNMAGWLADAGFKVEEPLIKVVPVGPWPKNRKLKEIGHYFLAQMLEGGMENYSMALFTKAGWDPIEVHALLGHVRKEIQNPAIHSFTKAWFLKATKPISGST